MAAALALHNLSSVDNSDDESDTLDCRTYFRSYKENEKYYSECLVENCHKRRLAGKQKFNLERHLSTVHNMKFVHHVPELPRKEITLKLQMDPALVYKAYVENLAIDGRPLVSANDGGMRKLVNPILQAFEKAKVHLDLSVTTVKAYMVKYTSALKSEIKQEVKNNIVHMKLDLARRHRRSVLGINVQFMKDDEIVVRTLAMMRTNSSHTGEYICELLMQTLDEYDIKYSQVHTITTDNGKNVLKSVRLFGAMENAESFQSDDLGSDDLCLDDFFNELSTDEEANENIDESSGGNNEENIDQLETNLNSAVSILQAKTQILNGLRCAAHTLQLVINVALKDTNYSSKLIKKCRRVVRTLLTPNMVNLIQQQHLRMPVIDCLTRWSSTYYMLKRLVELKDFYSSMISFMPFNCKLNDSDWHNLNGILNILSFFESTTKKLQAVNFTVADFYYVWHELKLELEAFSGVELVDNLLAQMETRKSELLENQIVHSCVFMDPRYHILLTEGNSSFCTKYM